MANIPSPFGGGGGDDGDLFDPPDAFVRENVPEPGPFLADHDVLSGEDHLAFHDTTRDLFEERGVYDMTFNYNLARLNRDTRHPGAGYRYAEDADDPGVLRAEFTPTTPFCPQSHTLTIGSFRAWNAEADRHDYDLVAVRVAPMHQASDDINEQLADLEARFRETGEVQTVGSGGRRGPGSGGGSDAGPGGRGAGRGGGPGGGRAPSRGAGGTGRDDDSDGEPIEPSDDAPF